MRIIVVDFDDTLFPTKHCKEEKINDFQPLCNSIKNLFDSFRKYTDKIFIITNAEKKWIEICFNTINLPMSNDIEIVSAYDKYDLHNRSIWKEITFDFILTPYFLSREYDTLISFGDSDWDRNASFKLKDFISNLVVKNIKFIEQPSLKEILQQHKIIIEKLQEIVNFQGDIDLKIDHSFLSTMIKSSEGVGESGRSIRTSLRGDDSSVVSSVQSVDFLFREE